MAGEGSLSDDPRKWWALAVLLLAQLMIILDIAIVAVAVPSAQHDLGISPADVQWVVTSYLLPFGGLLLLGGRVADYTGRKRVFCVAAVGFAFASALGGAAGSEAVLFAARALQGLFAAGMAPALLSMLTLGFPSGTDRTRAFALYGGVGAAGATFGLVIGGALTEYLSWRWCLLVNVPISLVVLAGAVPLLRESKAVRSRRYDVPGGILGTLGLLAAVYGIATAADNGWSSTSTLLPLAGGVLVVAAFIAWEARAAHPLLPLAILRDRTRAGGFLTLSVIFGAPSAVILLVLMYLQGPRGLSPLMAGVSFAPVPVAGILAALATIKLADRVPARVLVGVPSALAALAALWFVRIDVDSSYTTDVLPGLIMLGCGTATAFVAANNLALTGVPDADSGIASAVANTLVQVASALGIAILSTIAAGAAADYVAVHGPQAADAALIHGNDEAFLVGAILTLALAVVAALLVRADAYADGPHASAATDDNAAPQPLAPSPPSLEVVATSRPATTDRPGGDDRAGPSRTPEQPVACRRAE